MVCEDVRRVVYFYLDGELSERRGQELKQHVDQCPDCGHRLTIQQRLRLFLRKRLASCYAPANLRDRIQQACRETPAELRP